MGFENGGESNKRKSNQEFWKKQLELRKKGFQLLSEEQIKKITQRLPQKASILEIGSFDGALLKQLKDSGNGYALTGSDFFPESEESVKKIVPEAKFIELDIAEKEITEKFDVIVMKFVLGSLMNELWNKVLEKVKNNCKQFVLITPTPKEGVNPDRQIFIPNDILQILLDKHFKRKELLEVQEEGDKDFNMEIYLLAEPKID